MRGADTSLTEAWHPAVFLHVPKTGGSSLRNAFDHQYGHAKVLRVNRADPNLTVDMVRRLAATERRKVAALVGHMPFGLHGALGVPCTYVTILRDPVKRILSLYAYLSRSDESRLGLTMPRGMSLEQFLVDWERAPLVRNEQTRLLAGPFPFGSSVASDATLAEAKRNVTSDIAVVGLTERFDESILVMQQVLGWGPPRYARRKVAPAQQVAVIPPELVSLISVQNELDTQLYAWASDLFDSQVDQHGVTTARVEQFRRDNARYFRLRDATKDVRRLSMMLARRGRSRST